MAKNTIARAQAGAIADGFVDSLGESGYKPFVPRGTLGALVELAALIIEGAQNNLNSGGHIGSGELTNSFKVLDPKSIGGKITLDIEAAPHYKFLNKGVAGTKSGNSEAGFKFKYSTPSTKMVDEISAWLERSHKVTVHLLKPHAISSTEKKNATLSDIDSAYMIARSITQKGIKQTGFFDKAVAIAQQYAVEKLGKGLKTDIINSLPDNLNDVDNSKK